MRNAGIIAGDSRLTQVNKALKSLHGGDLVYSRISSNGPENGSEVVTLNCTLCHEARALIQTGTNTFKAVRQPWATEGYITKNTKLMARAVQDAVALAAAGDACAQGPEKYLFAAIYEIQNSKHRSTNADGSTNYVDLDPRRMMSLSPDSSFHNPSGQMAHSALNMLVNKGSWANGKPSSVDQAYQMFRPEDVLFNNQFFGFLNANYNQLYGINRDGTAAPVNFALNSSWGQKWYTPTDNMFHGMGCSHTNELGQQVFVPCDSTEKAIALAAATNSQLLNPNLSTNTLNLFPGVPYDYKWPVRKYSGTDGVFERTRELFIGIDSNLGNPMVNEVLTQRNITVQSLTNGAATYSNRCADCHGNASAFRPNNGYAGYIGITPPSTDVFKFVGATKDMPARAYIANLRNQDYVQTDSAKDLVMKQFDGFKGHLYYGKLPSAGSLNVTSLVGLAFQQRFGCYLSLDEFLARSTPPAIAVTTSIYDMNKLGFVKEATWAAHTSLNETAALGSARHRIYWHKEQPECGALDASGMPQPTQFYDSAFHGDRLSGSNPYYPALSATERKELMDFLVVLSFNVNEVGIPDSGFGTTKMKITYARYKGALADISAPYTYRDIGGSRCSSSGAKFGEACDPNVSDLSKTSGAYCTGDIEYQYGAGPTGSLPARNTLSCNALSKTYNFCGSCVGKSACGMDGKCGSGVVYAPTITSISPTSGPVGTVVTITGANLFQPSAEAAWMAPDTSLNGAVVAADTVETGKLTFVVPSGATSGVIRVSNPAGAATSSTAFTVTGTGTGTVAAPVISSFSPASGPVGSSVVITGSNFTGATAVGFGSLSNGLNASFTVNSPTQITAIVPMGVTGMTLRVTTSGGTATSASSFTVSASASPTCSAPTITGFSPTSGPSGTLVTITGTNLVNINSVTFNGVNATIGSQSGSQMTVYASASGTIRVTKSCGSATSTASFTISGGSCFTAGTKIMTLKGLKNIEDIKLREKVYSFDMNTKKVVVGEVYRTWVTGSQKYGKVVLSNGIVLNATEEHPFYMVRKGVYVVAKELKSGDVLYMMKKGQTLAGLSAAEKKQLEEVTVKEVTPFDQTADVYNFSVKNYSSYFAEGILVHNK